MSTTIIEFPRLFNTKLLSNWTRESIKNSSIIKKNTFSYYCFNWFSWFTSFSSLWVSFFCIESQPKLKIQCWKFNFLLSFFFRKKTSGRTIIQHDNDNGEPLKYHAINIVGYSNTKGVDYWIIRNNWDITWGDKGYGYLAANKNLMQIEQYPFVVIL